MEAVIPKEMRLETYTQRLELSCEKPCISWLAFGFSAAGIRDTWQCFEESSDRGFVLRACVSGSGVGESTAQRREEAQKPGAAVQVFQVRQGAKDSTDTAV